MELNTHELIEYLRAKYIKASQSVDKRKSGGETANGKDFSVGYWSGQRAANIELLRQLIKMGVEFKPDESLIAEAENLISKYPMSFFAGHELNRNLHYYKEQFRAKNYDTAILCETSMRQTIVRAKLENLVDKSEY